MDTTPTSTKNMLICRPARKTVVNFAIETIKTFDESDLRIRDGMILAGFVLLIIGALTYWGDRKPGREVSRVRIYVALYAFCTALFGFIRATIDTNKVLLVGAATHNTFEWGLFGVFSHNEKNARIFFAYSVAWIWFVITVTIYLPKLIYSFLFEQSFGLWCDYFMLFIYTYRLYYSSYNSPGRDIFKYGLYASIWHFGQIYTLIGLGLGVIKGWVALAFEWMLIFSVVPTFYYNRIVALKWEEMIYNVEHPQTKVSQPIVSDPNEEGRSEKDPLLNSSEKIQQGEDLRINIPSSHKYFILGVCLVLSWITIFGPLIIPECPAQPGTVKPTIPLGPAIPSFPEIPSTAVTGMAIINTAPNNKEALLEELQQVIIPVRKEAGCISYNLFENPLKPGQFAFIETWASSAALQIHLESPNVKAIFGQPYYNSLVESVESTQLIGPFQVVEPGFPVSGLLSMVFQFTVNCPIDYVWPKISNFSDSTFVMGTKKTYLEAPDVKVMVLENEHLVKMRLLKLDNDNHQWIQQMVSGLPFKAYTATVTLTPGKTDPQNTTLSHYLAEFMGPYNMSDSDARKFLWSDFYHNRIPYVKTLFNCDAKK